ncbi:MAG: ferredoxin [Actinomycetota bacterium]|jgi:ferredoxin|nr:ferredoxin [Actinomycetota bacterium]
MIGTGMTEGATMGYSVSIDRDACISSGNCVADSPTAFDFDDDDIAVVKVEGAAELPDERLLRVARNCPAGAIILRDAEGNEVDLFG